MKLSTFISELCVDRFAPLLPYFENLQLSDLPGLDEELIIESVPRPHKILARVFIHRKLQRYLTMGDDPFLAYGPLWKNADIEPRIEKGILRFVSSLSSILDEYHPSTCRLEDDILQKLDVDTIVRINLGSNHLRDEDMDDVIRLVKRCPNCTHVDLSANDLKSCDDKLLALIQREGGPGVTVDVMLNPIASNARSDFWSVRTAAELAHLIWIPQIYLASSNWHALTMEVDLVYQTHKQYYG